jgi:hypothetical protein
MVTADFFTVKCGLARTAIHGSVLHRLVDPQDGDLAYPIQPGDEGVPAAGEQCIVSFGQLTGHFIESHL